MQELRTQLAGIPGAQYEFARPALLTLATPVEVILAGYDLERLDLAASAVRARMEASGAFKDIRSSIEGGHPEIQILFDQERASQLGLAVRDIADRVVSNVRGNVATRYRLQEKKIDVLVRSVDTRAASIEEVRNLVVNPGSEHPVPLSAVADVRLATGPAEIRRANQERVAVISAAPASGDLGDATAQAQEILAQTTLPVGILGTVSGQSEEMTQSFRSLGLAFALAVFLVYLVMASQFESLLHPFVILFTIPDGAHRLGLGAVHHRHHHQLGGAHRSHHAGGHRGEQRHRADRRHQPGARTRPGKDRGHQARGTHAPAADSHHQREHHHRPHPHGHRHRRRRGNPPADGHHRDRRQLRRHLPHADRDPGAVRRARSQGVREDCGRQGRAGRCPRRRCPSAARSTEPWCTPTSRCAGPSPRSWPSPRWR